MTRLDTTRATGALLLAGLLPAQRDTVTVVDASANAFAYPLPTLNAAERRAFLVGNSFFKQNWVASPSSTPDRDGLGPLFNARSCSACHLRDGRSAPPGDVERERHGLLVRIGVPSEDGGEDRAHPTYGGQIQDVGLDGVRPEARVVLREDREPGQYGDGSPFELLRLTPSLEALGYGPIGEPVALGGRTAPHLVGLGLLEAIAAADLLAHADPDDRDGDGISGRPHWLGTGATRQLGRFGWKATQPTVAAQTAAALVHDMGITSPLQPREPLGQIQVAQLEWHASQDLEIDAATLERLVFYTRTIAVPAPRDLTAHARGEALFRSFGCAACHVPKWTTAATADAPFRSRAIAPYTDLLLHDLGDGLADPKRDGEAARGEWRTAPLWGIGLIPTVNGHSRLLHDGRARDIAEAILWHGGEAHAARERFRTADQADRVALLDFVRAL